MQDATLVILLKGNPVSEVLLGCKKVGFGQGKYTGFGGKIEPGERIVEAALRELAEESGIRVSQPDSLNFRAILEFYFPYKRAWEQRVYVFTTRHWEGKPEESSEMVPQFFAVDDIPYEKMWDDAHNWLPLIFTGQNFKGQFRYGKDNMVVKKAEFNPLR